MEHLNVELKFATADLWLPHYTDSSHKNNMYEEEDGLLNIYVSDAEEDPVAKKAQRTDQTEEDFQTVKRTYDAKVENGEVRCP